MSRRVRRSSGYRMFDGKRFYCLDSDKDLSKRAALRAKKAYKYHGQLVRIVETKSGYNVYTYGRVHWKRSI